MRVDNDDDKCILSGMRSPFYRRIPRPLQPWSLTAFWMTLWLGLSGSALRAQPEIPRPYFGIQVVDEETHRGIPLVQLQTVNQLSFVTDSAGWIAFHEPELMDREVYFSISSPGYEQPPDGFGFRGAKLLTRSGSSVRLTLRRTNISERLYRITGEGIYRDSMLLGQPVPDDGPSSSALTLGQDSVQAVPYRGRIFWLWGDTNLASYPLGNFHTTAATSAAPGDGLDPDRGIPLQYFLTADGTRVAPMAPDEQPGAVWLFGLLSVDDPAGQETLLAHYSRHLSLAEVAEHGLVRFDHDSSRFVKIAQLDLAETWRFPRGNAVRVREGEREYFYFSESFANVRAPADWDSLLQPSRYEALVFDENSQQYIWQSELPPTSQEEERKLIESGKMPRERARYAVVDRDTAQPVVIHRSSIVWNPFCKLWLLIGTELGNESSPSPLGEIWLAAADHPDGPWREAIQVASHPHYSYYNPRQHPFLAGDEGRFVYFEGTYTRAFSDAPQATPRYDYNQIMYRLDLSDDRLRPILSRATD